MNINHQISLFFEYRMSNRLILKLEKELNSIKGKRGLSWERKKEYNEKSLNKWLNRKKEIIEEWNSINDFQIEEFPYIRKDEILKYYNNPKRKNDRNPFLDYYK